LNEPADSVSDPVAELSIATRFVRARLAGQSLDAYPGPLPVDLEQAYRRQDLAIGLWPDALVGWKVGKIPDAWTERLGEDRLVGPVFARQLRHIEVGSCLPLEVIAGGFAAVEAEYIFVLGADAPADKFRWTHAEAADLVAALHLGIEFAGSPLATINQLGPAVVVSDFGNNAGVLLGPEVAHWRSLDMQSLSCETWIADQCVGRGGAAFISGGLLEALVFALERNARRGRPLRAGMLVSTGASTGIHDIAVGQRAQVRFAGGTVLTCEAVPAQPQPSLRSAADVDA
jgi:2-keto-4-pentenoate hydratase